MRKCTWHIYNMDVRISSSLCDLWNLCFEFHLFIGSQKAIPRSDRCLCRWPARCWYTASLICPAGILWPLNMICLVHVNTSSFVENAMPLHGVSLYFAGSLSMSLPSACEQWQPASRRQTEGSEAAPGMWRGQCRWGPCMWSYNKSVKSFLLTVRFFFRFLHCPSGYVTNSA